MQVRRPERFIALPATSPSLIPFLASPCRASSVVIDALTAQRASLARGGAECSGKNLYVPKTTDKEHGIMDLFRIFGEDDLRALPRGLWGIREPEPEYMGRQRPTGQ